jgi:hypothetical protein
MKTTHTSHSTGSDDGLWTHLDGHTVYTIEFSYWEDLDSSAIATHGKYNVQAGYVEVPDIESTDVRDARVLAEMHGALRFCGYELHAQTGAIVNEYDGALVCERGTARTSSEGRKARRRWLLCVAECMWRYGAKHVTCDVSGNNRRKLMREAHCSF